MCCAGTGVLVDRLSRYYKGIPVEGSRGQCSITQYYIGNIQMSLLCRLSYLLNLFIDDLLIDWF